jgi:hypothetical protein
MADDLDQGYIQTRQTMREYQNSMLMEPTQVGSDVYMGAQSGGKPQEGEKAGTPGQATTPQPDPLAPATPGISAQPSGAPRPDITVDTPEMAAVRQQGKEQVKPYVFDLDTFDVPGDVVRAGLAKLSGVDRGDKEGTLRMSSDEMVNKVFFQYGDKPEEVIKRAEELGLPEADTLKIMLGLSAVVVGMVTDPLNVTPGGKAKDVAKVGKVVGEVVSRTKPIQKRIWEMSSDELTAAMEAKAHADANINREVLGDKAEEFAALEKRLERTQNFSDTPGYKEAERRYNEILDSIPQEQQNRMFGVGEKDPQVTEYRAFQRALEEVSGDTPQELGQSISRAITEVGNGTDPSAMTHTQQIAYAQIRHAFEEAKRMGWDTKEVSKAAIAYSARRFSDPEDAAFMLERYMKPAGEPQDKNNILLEFKRAANILKDQRGSVPLGPGGAGPEAPLSAKALTAISKREESKQAHEFALEGFKEELTKQRRGPVLSDEAVRKLAGESGFTLQDLIDLKPGSVLAPEIQVKAREVYKATVDNMKQSAKAYLATGSPQDFDAFAEAFTFAGLSTTRIIGTYSEAGRTFRLLNQKYPSLKKPGAAQATDPEFSIQDQYIQEMYKFFRGVEEKYKVGGFDKARTGQGMGPGGMISPGQLAQMVMDLPSEEAMMNFAKAALKPTWGDMFYEIWVNGLLSGPMTHSTNIISNAATLLWNIPERQVASLLKPGSVRPGEAAAMVGGVLESVGDAWRLAWKAFKEDAPQFGASKLENMPRRAITADALEVTGIPGRAIDFLASAVGLGQGKWLDVAGTGVRLPGRFLMAGDDFFKAIAFRAELRALAKRQAFREVNELGLTGKEAARKAKEIEHKILTDPPETIKQDAQEFAAYTTFTRELGTAGSAVQMAVQNVPFGRVVLPFIRTPANIFKFAGERTPFALASKAVREELAAGGERQALALAKIGLGSMTMGYMASLAASGYITGGGPKDKVLRKQLELEGWQPYSFKIGKEYVSFARIEPLGSLIGMAADAADLMGQLGEKDSAELASALTVALSRNVANKTFVKGLAGTLNAVTSQDVHVVKSFLEKELPTLMPYSSAIGQTAKVVDPVMRDVQSILDAFKAKVPGFSDELPPMRNLWGEKILLQGGLGPDLVSPLYVREIKDDKVAQELNRLKYPFTLPSRKIDGIDLPPTVYDRYSEIAGIAKLLGNMNLHDKMQQTINSSLYKMAADGPDGGRVTLLREDLRIFRDLAAIELEKENKDFAQARQLQRMRAATKFDANARQKQGAAPTLR